jgi:hypothetical protein
MIDTWVFDHTALIALFDAQPDLMRMWRRADAGTERLVFPAAAVAEANHAREQLGMRGLPCCGRRA